MRLPELTQQLIELIGLPATLKLTQKFGGLPLYIPIQPERANLLAQVLPADKIRLLCERFGGETIGSIPKGLLTAFRDQSIRYRKQHEYATNRQLAIEYHLTQRHIINICHGIDDETGLNQLSLF